MNRKETAQARTRSSLAITTTDDTIKCSACDQVGNSRRSNHICPFCLPSQKVMIRVAPAVPLVTLSVRIGFSSLLAFGPLAGPIESAIAGLRRTSFDTSRLINLHIPALCSDGAPIPDLSSTIRLYFQTIFFNRRGESAPRGNYTESRIDHIRDTPFPVEHQLEVIGLSGHGDDAADCQHGLADSLSS